MLSKTLERSQPLRAVFESKIFNLQKISIRISTVLCRILQSSSHPLYFEVSYRFIESIHHCQHKAFCHVGLSAHTWNTSLSALILIVFSIKLFCLKRWSVFIPFSKSDFLLCLRRRKQHASVEQPQERKALAEVYGKVATWVFLAITPRSQDTRGRSFWAKEPQSPCCRRKIRTSNQKRDFSSFRSDDPAVPSHFNYDLSHPRQEGRLQLRLIVRCYIISRETYQSLAFQSTANFSSILCWFSASEIS